MALDNDMEKTLKRMELQNKEFDACGELAKAYKAHSVTTVVDDDYPMVRSRYEGALRAFLKAVVANRGKV